MNRGKLSIITCKSGESFARRVEENLKEPINEYITENQHEFTKEEQERRKNIWIGSNEVHFANKELKTVINQNIRGDDVYIIQCMDDPLCKERSVNDNLMALLTAINAAYQSDAEQVTAVIPQFPYSRQDRKKGRECITAKQVANFIEISGATRVITMDIHSESIEGFFNKTRLENLHASRVIIDYFQEIHSLDNLVVVSPDAGGTHQARFYSRNLGRFQISELTLEKLAKEGFTEKNLESLKSILDKEFENKVKFEKALDEFNFLKEEKERIVKYSRIVEIDFAIVDKERNYDIPGTIESMRLIGNVTDKDVLIVDDMIATGGTLINAVKLIKKHGAKDIYIACSLPFFNGDAIKQIDDIYQQGFIKKIIGTDAVFLGQEFINSHEWYEEISIAPLFAKVIFHINMKKSVSDLLKYGS